mgnify:CR=1 FL=1
MKENLLIDKSISFAVRIIKLYQYLIKTKKESIISKQIIRSGTSIGANINEANYGQSKKDFISKMHIALKETAETEYWIKLLNKTDLIDDKLCKEKHCFLHCGICRGGDLFFGSARQGVSGLF